MDMKQLNVSHMLRLPVREQDIWHFLQLNCAIFAVQEAAVSSNINYSLPLMPGNETSLASLIPRPSLCVGE